MSLARIRIGTRKSALALAQTDEVRLKLLSFWPTLDIETVQITTTGDKFLDGPLANIGGKGLFTKELEDAMLDGRIDIAVHSMKDMQTVLPDGLTIGCMLEREDARDMLVGVNAINDIPQGGLFGTSSLRRSAQMLIKRPDLKIVPLRGNVQTRLAKLEQGEMHATMLAKAGLNRLKLKKLTGALLPIHDFIPAVAQGAIGIECRKGDEAVLELLKPLSHAQTEIAVHCERAFLRALDGSCRTPIAGYAEIKGNDIHLQGMIARPDGLKYYKVEHTCAVGDAEKMGRDTGLELLAKAGKNFL